MLVAVTQLGSLLQPTWRNGQSGTGAESGPTWQRQWYGALWCLGLAQQYRLLDWIDDRNYRAELVWSEAGQQQRTTPSGLRAGLALSYLTPAVWVPLNPSDRLVLQQSCEKRWLDYLGLSGRPGQLTVEWKRVR